MQINIPLTKGLTLSDLILVNLLIMCSSGLMMNCSDPQTIEEAAADVTAPDGVLPIAGPRLMIDDPQRLSPALMATPV